MQELPNDDNQVPIRVSRSLYTTDEGMIRIERDAGGSKRSIEKEKEREREREACKWFGFEP